MLWVQQHQAIDQVIDQTSSYIYRPASTGHIIFPTVLFVVVWHGRDGENLPTGYNPVFFGWDGMDGWMGWMGWVEVRVRILL